MEYEWDAEKSANTLARRAIDFRIAVGIFQGPTVEHIDARRDYGEARVRTIGRIGSRILVVVYTDRPTGRRIISARAANKQERMQWLKLYG